MAVNILVVDDSKVMRSMLIKTIKLTGLEFGEIHQAANGREGLDALEKNWIDLILADINMPVMNGEEMINAIREVPSWKELPIIVISTEGSQTRIDSIHKKGARFIHKPFTPEIVRNVLEEILGMEYAKQN